MATPNYNLPTITGNMTADVVRDVNALAVATDSAIKDAVDGVDSRLTAHLDETTKFDFVQLNSTMSLTKSDTPIVIPFGVSINPAYPRIWVQGNGDFVLTETGMYIFEISIGEILSDYLITINNVNTNEILHMQKMKSDRTTMIIPFVIVDTQLTNNNRIRLNINLTAPGTGTYTLYPDIRYSWCLLRKVA